MPVLLIAANSAETYQKSVETLVKPIGENKFSVELPFESFAIETNPEKDLPQVPDYGVALINNGTAGVSLEKGNVLTLFLMHTAIFPGVNLPFEFVPEHKTHVFNYSLYPHEKDWREADTVKVGYDVNNPLIAIQTDIHDGNLPSANSFLMTNSANENLILSALKVTDDPQATFQNPKRNYRTSLEIRFYESEGFRGVGAISPSIYKHKPILDAIDIFERTNFIGDKIENPFNKVRNTGGTQFFNVALERFGIENYEFKTNRKAPDLRLSGKFKDETDKIQPDSTAELTQPVFSRYWMHNAGAAPIGNDAVKVSLRPVEQQGELSTFAYDDKYNQGGTTTIAVRVQVVNNYQNRRVSGKVFLEVPEDWRVVPASLKYDIPPNGSFVQDVSVLGFPVKKDLEFERASGLIKARITHDGQTFQDVLNIGKPFKLDWTTEQTATETIIKIRNPYRQQIEGAVALITPPETWYFKTPKFPREIGFAVQPNSETVLRFAHGEFPAGTWRIARIAYNGNVEYKR